MLSKYVSNEFNFELGEWENKRKNRFTAIIGSNGTGKSRLLSDIASNFLYAQNKSDYLKKRLIENGHANPFEGNSHTQSNLLVVSNLITDTFPFTRSLDERYKYLGHKRGSNMFTTGSLNHLMVSAFLDLHQKLPMLHRFQRLTLKELNISNTEFRLKTLNTNSIEDQLRERLRRTLDEEASSLRISRLTGLESINTPSLIEAFIKRISGWLNSFTSFENDEKNKWNLSSKAINDFINICDDFFVKPSATYNLLKQSRIGILDLIVFKVQQKYEFEKLSTGEQLLLSTIARISANLSDNSLILIDEPEVGLHPNWQQRFLKLISDVLPTNFGCHFLIATHSPFIASEADDILVPGDTWGNFVEYPDSIAARSIDDILYRVFGARISGNTSVQRDVQLLLEHLSGTQLHDQERVRKTFARLSKIVDSDTIELNNVLREVSKEF